MTSKRFTTLDEWLAWQEQLHPRAIDLSLERVHSVLERLHSKPPPYTVITVGGTNGKGSCVAFLEAMLLAGGYRVGAYTSPHLLRYNERVRVNGVEATNETLCEIFARIDAARGDISLTYFEFGTLAAVEIFREAGVAVALLEVGLGGRLDAVNCLNADAAVVTAVGIDHVEWLGPDRDSIGREKAGIFRRARPAICADPAPPRTLLDYARGIGSHLYLAGQDYGFHRAVSAWNWWSGSTRLDALPLPALAGEHQLSNAAAALMALNALSERLPISSKAIREGIARANVAARFQIVPGPVERIIDVTHNAHGAAVLARCLLERPCAGRTHAVLGMLQDKDVAEVARVMANSIDTWYAATLNGPRGLPGERLAAVLKASGIGGTILCFDSVAEALQCADREAEAGDRLVVFGSFYTAAEALALSLRESRIVNMQTLRGVERGFTA